MVPHILVDSTFSWTPLYTYSPWDLSFAVGLGLLLLGPLWHLFTVWRLLSGLQLNVGYNFPSHCPTVQVEAFTLSSEIWHRLCRPGHISCRVRWVILLVCDLMHTSAKGKTSTQFSLFWLSAVIFASFAFKVPFALLTAPCHCRWYTQPNFCLIPSIFVVVLITSATKCGPLSERTPTEGLIVGKLPYTKIFPLICCLALVLVLLQSTCWICILQPK